MDSYQHSVQIFQMNFSVLFVASGNINKNIYNVETVIKCFCELSFKILSSATFCYPDIALFHLFFFFEVFYPGPVCYVSFFAFLRSCVQN